MPLARMRTAENVLRIIKQEDPETGVTLHYIRRIIKTGKIPVTCVGRKKLVDADKVIAFIADGEATSIPEPGNSPGQIRRVRA